MGQKHRSEEKTQRAAAPPAAVSTAVASAAAAGGYCGEGAGKKAPPPKRKISCVFEYPKDQNGSILYFPCLLIFLFSGSSYSPNSSRFKGGERGGGKSWKSGVVRESVWEFVVTLHYISWAKRAV